MAVPSLASPMHVVIDPPLPDRSQMFWRRHVYILPAFLISLTVCAWFATWGDWKFFQRESLGAFYDAQALSIMDGRLDVPRQAIGFEAFIVDGKYYGYFGIGPALLRIPLLLMFSKLDGLWSRAMLMTASLLAIACAYRILVSLRRDDAPRTISQNIFDSIFIIAAAIGSTNVFIVARSFVYHEAIMWGSTFGLLWTCAFVSYLRSPNLRSLILAATFAFMSFQSRATVGAGALLAMCVLAVALVFRVFAKRDVGEKLLALAHVDHAKRHTAIVIVAVTLTIGTFFGVNYAKFGTLSTLPLKYYDIYAQDSARMEITGGSQLHLSNLPTGIATYLGFRGTRLQAHFPWIYLANEPTFVGPPSTDMVEGFSTFPVSMPALTLLAVIGAFTLATSGKDRIRQLRLPTAALLLGGSITFMSAGISERYLHDLYPALIIGAAVGLSTISLGRLRTLKITSLVLLACISIACNCAFALVHQRVSRWGVPSDKRAEFDRLQQRIDAHF